LLLATVLQTQPSPAPAAATAAAPTPSALADIALPQDNDTFSDLVRRAHAGDETVDFLALRRAYLGSPAAARAGKAAAEVDRLRADMFAAVEAGDATRVHGDARAILALDYIDLDAQKFLRQSCKILEDEACATRHHFVQFGLLKSITSTGDGRTCATAWNVVDVAEEYFVLRVGGLVLKSQSVESATDRMCDRLEVVDGETGASRTIYFDVTEVFKDYERRFTPTSTTGNKG
jgi:hypothetical protein